MKEKRTFKKQGEEEEKKTIEQRESPQKATSRFSRAWISWTWSSSREEGLLALFFRPANSQQSSIGNAFQLPPFYLISFFIKTKSKKKTNKKVFSFFLLLLWPLRSYDCAFYTVRLIFDCASKILIRRYMCVQSQSHYAPSGETHNGMVIATTWVVIVVAQSFFLFSFLFLLDICFFFFFFFVY